MALRASSLANQLALLLPGLLVAVCRGQLWCKPANPGSWPHSSALLPCGCRYTKLATLEFDRDRKSMSVICAPSNAGPTTPARRSSRLAGIIGGGSSNGSSSNKLFIKGAAECVLQRCSKIMLADGSVVALDAKTRANVEK